MGLTDSCLIYSLHSPTSPKSILRYYLSGNQVNLTPTLILTLILIKKPGWTYRYDLFILFISWNPEKTLTFLKGQK